MYDKRKVLLIFVRGIFLCRPKEGQVRNYMLVKFGKAIYDILEREIE